MQLLMLPILFGLAVIAIPVIIHLLHRQKSTPIAWGAMQFLIPTPLQAKRRKKVEHWLLMLLRIAGLAVLVFLLARPIFQSNRFNPLGGATATDVIIVIDHSLSTGRRTVISESVKEAAKPGEAPTIFDRSVAATNELASQLHPADTLTIILAEHKPHLLTDRPVSGSSSDLTRVRETLSRLKPGLGDADIPAAVQVAREAAAHGRNLSKRIIVLGDEQRSGWQVENTGAWKTALADNGGAIDKNLTLFEVPIAADSSISNISVSRIDVRPAVIGPNRPVEITATLSNTGSVALNHLPVNLIVDGKPAGAQVIDELPGGSSRTVRFEQAFSEAGSHSAKVTVEVIDALGADNTAAIAINVLEKLPVLIIDGQLTAVDSFRSSQFLAAAMEPLDPTGGQSPLIRPKLISVSDAATINVDDYAAVIVNDVAQLPPEALSRLADFATAGHGVWFILGPKTQPKLVADQLKTAGLFAAEFTGGQKTAGKDASTPPPGITVNDPANRMVSLLTTANRNGMAGAVTTGWWPIKPTEADERVILTSTTGDPLVIERPLGNRGGRVVVWATSVDGLWNNWPLLSNFLPLVQETIFHLAGGAVGVSSGTIDAGKPLRWSAPVSQPVMSAMMTRPDGSPPAPARIMTESDKQIVRYDEADIPGLYEMRFNPTGLPQPVYFAVGIDPRELDPSILSEADISNLHDAGFLTARVPLEKLSSLVGGDRNLSELWPSLAMVVVGILVLETFMTYRMVRLQAGRDVTLGVAR